MSDVEFEKLDEAIEYSKNNADIGPVHLWAAEHQYDGMTKADCDKIVAAVWNVFGQVKGGEYDPDSQYLASTLTSVAEWAADEETSIDLKLEGNFDAFINRCVENDDIVEAMNLGLCVRKNGDIQHYKKLIPIMVGKADSEWGWSDEDHEPGILQIFLLHDLTKSDAEKLLEIAKSNSNKKVLKNIASEHEWRSEADDGDYGSFHADENWQTSTME